VTETRRSYSRKEKAAAVGMAEGMGARPAARKSGVPEANIRYWRTQPEFARLRAETKQEVANDVWATFQLGVKRIAELIPKTDDISKVAIATGVIYDKFALISGQATTRSEKRDITEAMDDHEREKLRAILEGIVLEEVPA
jgi:transposase-like protein